MIMSPIIGLMIFFVVFNFTNIFMKRKQQQQQQQQLPQPNLFFPPPEIKKATSALQSALCATTDLTYDILQLETNNLFLYYEGNMVSSITYPLFRYPIHHCPYPTD